MERGRGEGRKRRGRVIMPADGKSEYPSHHHYLIGRRGKNVLTCRGSAGRSLTLPQILRRKKIRRGVEI